MKTIFQEYDVVHLLADGGSNYGMAAGTTDVVTNEVDAANCTELSFLVTYGTISTGGTVDCKVQGSNTSGSGYVDLEGTALTQIVAADDDKCHGVSIVEPAQYRYYVLSFTRGDGGNSVIQSVTAFRKVRSKPVAQSTAAGQFKAEPEFHHDPATGTA